MEVTLKTETPAEAVPEGVLGLLAEPAKRLLESVGDAATRA
jgi:hypothetical protein